MAVVTALLLIGLSFSAGAALPTVPSAAVEPAWSSGIGGLLQAVLGLALVVALIFLCGWALRRLGLQPAGNAQLLKVVASTMVGQRERVVVLEIGDAWLVLGVAAGHISALHTLPAKELSTPQASTTIRGLTGSMAFSQSLLQSLDKLRRRAG